MLRLLTVIGALLLVPLGASSALAGHAPAPGRDTHRVEVRGTGGGTLDLPGFEGDRVRFTVRATTGEDRPVDVEGTFHVTHRTADGRLLADFRGRVDCLMSGGDTAVLTGVIRRGSAPGLPGSGDLVGRRIGLSVGDDGNQDRLGWSWLVTGFHDVAGCTGIAPIFPVTAGGFQVRGETRL